MFSPFSTTLPRFNETTIRPKTLQHNHRRLYVLDGFRLLAALAVVAYHLLAFNRGLDNGAWKTPPQDLFPTATPLAGYGWLGVEFFFLISGFVICMSCWGKPLSQFFTSRLTRLYPAYWFAVLATTIVLTLWPVVRAAPDAKTIWINLTMLQRPWGVDDLDGVYWSLWAELRFYLLFAVLVIIGLTYRRVVTFCGIWLASGILAPYLESDLFTMFALPQYGPLFVGGIAMYLMYKFRPTLLLWSLIIVSWLLMLRQIPDLIVGAETSTDQKMSGWIVAAILTSAYLLILAAALGAFHHIQWGWLTTAGALTYPLYLLHQNIGWTVIRLTHQAAPPWIVLAATVIGLLLLSWLVHKFIERPIARFIKRQINNRFTKTTRVDPVESQAPS